VGQCKLREFDCSVTSAYWQEKFTCVVVPALKALTSVAGISPSICNTVGLCTSSTDTAPFCSVCKDTMAAIKERAMKHEQRVTACGQPASDALTNYRKKLRSILRNLVESKVGADYCIPVGDFTCPVQGCVRDKFNILNLHGKAVNCLHADACRSKLKQMHSSW
jgi:hypothetical protein